MTSTALTAHTEGAHPAVAGLGGGSVLAIVPQTFDEVYRFSQVLAKSGLCPYGMDTPEKVSVAILTGLEIGVKPMQAVQGIAVIGGRPCIWGDLALGVVRGAGTIEYIRETYEGDESACDWTAAKPAGAMLDFKAVCRIKRRGEPEHVTEFSIRDAVVAKLWGKRGHNGKDTPWITSPRRMLKMRARGFGLRDTHADVLKGLYIAEEMIGVEDDGRPQVSGPTPPPPAIETRPEEPAAPPSASTGPAAPPVEEAEFTEAHSPVEGGGSATEQPTMAQEDPFDPEAWLDEVRDRFAEARTEADVDGVHDVFGDTVDGLGMVERQKYEDLYGAALQRVAGAGQPEQTETTGEPGPAPQDEDDDFPGASSIGSKPPSEAEQFSAAVEALCANPDRTRSWLKAEFGKLADQGDRLIASGALPEQAFVALREKVMANFRALPAANPPGGKPAAPPADQDPAAAFDAEFRARVAACTTIDEVNAAGTDTLKRRNEFGSEHPMYLGWRQALQERRMQIGGLAG